MFRVVESLDDLLKAHAVRAIVFIEGQNCPYSLEVDSENLSAVHIIGERNGEPCAAGRIRFLGDTAKLERLAVREAYRGQGLGKDLLQFMLGVAREKGYSRFKLHAQIHALPFYEKHGFTAKGDIFLEAGIEHKVMVADD
jgi:predicted GNAT family N-acyltransferase